MNKVVKTIIEYGLIIVAVIIIRIFVITPIQVNGDSMKTTLYDNDIMILNIIGYNLNGLKRFDIIVVDYENEHLIKRVIGFPGEKVDYIDNTLYINGKEIKDVVNINTEDFSTNELCEDGIIPKNKYFVLGDNRNISADSRTIGLIDKKDILGKTNLVLFPFKRFGIVK